MSSRSDVAGMIAMPFLILVPLAGWATHMFICFREHQWGFLVAGALFFPVGVIHGWGRWFGWW